MSKKIKLNSVYYKYLLSSIVLLLIPLLLLGYFGYDQLTEGISRTVQQTNEASLSRIRHDMDAKLVEMNKIAGRIASTPELTPYALRANLYQAYQGKRLLDSILTSDFIHEVLLYIRGEELLYSPYSTYRVPLFINHIYRYRDWDEKQFLHDLNASEKPSLRPGEEVLVSSSTPHTFVTYMVPIPIGSQSPYGTVLFLLKEEEMLNVSGPSAAGLNGKMIVFDDRHRIVSATHRSDGLPPGLYEQITSRPSFSIANLLGTDYFLSYARSDQTNWTYALLLPVSDVMKPIREAAGLWWKTLLLIFLIGSGVTYVVVHYNYNPIKRLSAYAETYFGRVPKQANELEAVHTLIRSMAESNRQLGQKVEQSRSALREHLLLSLLKGEIETNMALKERSQDAGICFLDGDFRVFLLDCGGLDEAGKAALSAQVEAAAEERVQLFRKERLEEARLLFIVCSDLPETEAAEWFQGLYRRLQEREAQKVTIGVGNAYRDPTQVGRSFLEASTAIDYKLIQGSNKIIRFSDIPYERTGGAWNPRQELEQVSALLRQGLPDQVEQAVKEIADKIKPGGMTLFEARCVCYDIINTVMHAVHELKEQQPHYNVEFPDVLTLMEFDSAEELAQLIAAACRQLAQTIAQSKEQAGDKLLGEMIGYLRAQYKAGDFSIQKMADDLSLSVSYVSRYFKEQTGKTISDYVNQLRIDQAKELLKDEDCTIKEIVTHVGYYDVSSFIRKFKALVGMTPGEFRKMYRS